MTRQRNLLPLAGLVVCVIAFLSYFLFFYQFPVTRDIPWANWLLFAVGLALVGFGIARPFRSPERYRGRYQGRVLGPVLGVLSVAILGLFLFVTLSFTKQLPASANAPQVGETAPDFTLPDIQGQPVSLASLREQPSGSAPGSWVLLIFYRGYW